MELLILLEESEERSRGVVSLRFDVRDWKEIVFIRKIVELAVNVKILRLHVWQAETETEGRDVREGAKLVEAIGLLREVEEFEVELPTLPNATTIAR